jgi:hypothetical protein
MEGQTWSSRRGACILTAFGVSKLQDIECALLNTAGKLPAEPVDGLRFLGFVDVAEFHVVCGNEPESTRDQSDSVNSVEYRIALQAP